MKKTKEGIESIINNYPNPLYLFCLNESGRQCRVKSSFYNECEAVCFRIASRYYTKGRLDCCLVNTQIEL